MDNVIQHPRYRHRRSVSRANSMKRAESLRRQEALRHETLRQESFRAENELPKMNYNLLQHQEGGSSSYSSTPEQQQQSSFYSIPQSSVPRRSSSHKYPQRQPRSHTRNTSITSKQAAVLGLPRPPQSIPNRGGSQSPVKEAGLRLDPITSDTSRRVPSRTHVRSPYPIEILDFPSYKHPRVKLELQVSAPIFVGGGSVEGHVRITVDDNQQVRHRRSISIGAVSVDLLGFEEVEGSRRSTFLALGSDVIDSNHPPPLRMVQPPDPLFAGDKFWALAPSSTPLPFMVSLPLDTGPPPFQSKRASIRFLLSVTALVRDAGKHYRVRTSQDIQVLPTYDPEKALTSLPSPLTAYDELVIPRSTGQELIRVTAGLHRQVWVSGGSIFVDVHVSNKSRRPVKRLELTLERDVLCYKHAAAATLQKSAMQARIFESNEQAILARSSFKPGSTGWNGVDPHTSDIRTCELELPRGHATVRCGKYFEVRYFLNVTASLSNSKLVSVQLPIILIHMNSLDVVPNSVAQVAAAIEEKRLHRQLSRSRSRRDVDGHTRQRSVSTPAQTSELKRKASYAQGRAFAAPRQQSLDRQREQMREIEDFRNIIDSSPRRHPPPSIKGLTIKKVGSNLSLRSIGLANRSDETFGVMGAMSYQTPPPNRSGRTFDEVEGLRDRLRRIGSFDSIRSKKSSATNRSKATNGANAKGQYSLPFHQQISPHVLGLTTTTRKVSSELPGERPSTSLSFRDKLDRSRFEFKAVRRKASGTLKERSKHWWDQRKSNSKDADREKERAGWI